MADPATSAEDLQTIVYEIGKIEEFGFENLLLDEFAADKVRKLLLVVPPLRLSCGVGSSINPIAIT